MVANDRHGRGDRRATTDGSLAPSSSPRTSTGPGIRKLLAGRLRAFDRAVFRSTPIKLTPDGRFVRRDEWAIGIVAGPTLDSVELDQRVENPVLTRRQVTDLVADYVADPFMICRLGQWVMYFEVMNRRTGRGEIALAVRAESGRWTYVGSILREPFHLSYPHVFEFEGDVFMTPESRQDSSVRLYRASNFPDSWEHVGNLLEGGAFRDPTPFRIEDGWGMFVATTATDQLSLYRAPDLLGPWTPHPRSPVVSGDPRTARPGGRVITTDGALFRPAQDCRRRYGADLGLVRVEELDGERYSESLVSAPWISRDLSWGWASGGMHHADLWRLEDGRWMGCIDGVDPRRLLSRRRRTR